ncbi:MAG: hypothetical protein CL725_10600 [Chloroflexi bacterium]|nr:hypothetical protein [Chloroflexota bacterium]
MTYRLHGAPAPFPTESPNSWLQRIAHRYDLGFADLQNTLGTRWTTDADLEMRGPAYGAIARVCGRPLTEVSLMYSIFGVGQGARVAIRDKERRPVYRFCVGCFQEDTVPHLRIEWRLAPWEACPRHLCRLRSSCVGCRKPWRMEAAVLRERASKAHTLAHCRWCGLDQRQTVTEKPSPNLTDAAKLGCAVVSALANGHAVITRGLSTFQVDVSFVLSNLHLLSAGRNEAYVNLVVDRTATVGVERRLALRRAGVDAKLRGRTRVLYDRYHHGLRDGGCLHRALYAPETHPALGATVEPVSECEGAQKPDFRGSTAPYDARQDGAASLHGSVDRPVTFGPMPKRSSNG